MPTAASRPFLPLLMDLLIALCHFRSAEPDDATTLDGFASPANDKGAIRHGREVRLTGPIG
jgi:hypothetical protein